ncbi:MAG: hypothetical protein WAW31_10155 [Smithella sp.]|jgi:hypothetical protein|nr:hypothetical protein [Syntrophaceae bacterium]
MRILEAYRELKQKLLPDEEPVDTIYQDYFLCFSSAPGKKVLSHLLTDLHFFDEALSDQEVIEQNIARRILHNIGAFHVEQIDNITGMLIKIAENNQKKQELKVGGNNGINYQTNF